MPAAASQRNTLARIRDFFNYAVAEKMVASNPCDGIVIKARPKKGKPTLTRAEARVLDRYLWNEVESDGPEAEVCAAILVLLYLGLRRGELLRLQVRDVDGRVVSVERRSKSRKAFRDIEAPQRLAVLLARRVVGRELTDWLWPSPSASAGHRGPTWVLKGVKRICKLAGVSQVTPQGLRATHGKLARMAGATAHAVQAQLGHEDVRTSVESYIGPDVDAGERSKRAQQVLSGKGSPPER